MLQVETDGRPVFVGPQNIINHSVGRRPEDVKKAEDARKADSRFEDGPLSLLSRQPQPSLRRAFWRQPDTGVRPVAC